MCQECEPLRMHVHELEREREQLSYDNAELADQISGLMTNVRSLSGRITRLKQQLNGSTTKETEEIREFLEQWDRLRRKLFSGCRDVQMDMDSDRAAVVRSAIRRGTWTLERLLKVLKGATLDPKTVCKRSHFEPENLLKKDRFMEMHEQMFEDYERLRDKGFPRPARMIRGGLSEQARPGAKGWWVDQILDFANYKREFELLDRVMEDDGRGEKLEAWAEGEDKPRGLRLVKDEEAA